MPYMPPLKRFFSNQNYNNVVSEIKYEIINNNTMNVQYRRYDSKDNWMHEVWTRAIAQ